MEGHQRIEQKNAWCGKPPPSKKPPTPTYHRVGSKITGNSVALTHPSHAPTNDVHIVGLKSLIHHIPNQATSNHDCPGFCIVRYLGKPSKVDVDPLCRRESRIDTMATAHHLGRRRTNAQPGHEGAKKLWPLTAKGVLVVRITLSCYQKGIWVSGRALGDGKRINVQFSLRPLECRAPPHTQDHLHLLRQSGVFPCCIRYYLHMYEFALSSQ